MKSGRKFAAYAMLLVTGSVLATAPPAIEREKVQPADFPQLVTKIRHEMSPGGRYLVKPEEYQEVNTDLEAMQRLLQGHASTNDLNQQQQVELFNYQERINALLTKRDGDELVCHSEHPTGSHMTQNVCTKRRDLEDSTQKSQQFWRDFERLGMPGAPPDKSKFGEH